jgi:hypothetical protein
MIAFTPLAPPAMGGHDLIPFAIVISPSIVRSSRDLQPLVFPTGSTLIDSCGRGQASAFRSNAAGNLVLTAIALMI